MTARPEKTSILVVDDEQILHESMKRILEEGGYSVDHAFRAETAKKMLSEGKYDIVLTDLMMPGSSGMDVVKEIAELYPDTGVIIVTGYPTVDSVVESVKLGAIDYLRKPFTPDELLDVVKRAVDKLGSKDRREKIQSGFQEVEKALASSLDLQEILKLTCSQVVKLLNVKGSAVLILKPQKRALEIASSCGLSQSYVDKGVMDSNKSIAVALQKGETIVVTDDEFDKNLQYPSEARNEDIHAIVSTPLRVKDTIIGFLRVYSRESRNFDDNEMNALLKFADYAAKSLENAMTFAQVRSDIEGMKKALEEGR